MDIARKEGLANVARLFEATAYAEFVHASNHAKNLEIPQKTADNLQAGIDGETFEFEDMYPAYKALAQLVEDKKAERAIDYALEAEKVHADYYQDAKEKVEQGQDTSDEKIHVCPTCGYTHYGEMEEDKCPVCNVPKEKFKSF